MLRAKINFYQVDGNVTVDVKSKMVSIWPWFERVIWRLNLIWGRRLRRCLACPWKVKTVCRIQSFQSRCLSSERPGRQVTTRLWKIFRSIFPSHFVFVKKEFCSNWVNWNRCLIWKFFRKDMSNKSLLLDLRAIDIGCTQEKDGHFHHKNFLRYY